MFIHLYVCTSVCLYIYTLLCLYVYMFISLQMASERMIVKIFREGFLQWASVCAECQGECRCYNYSGDDWQKEPVSRVRQFSHFLSTTIHSTNFCNQNKQKVDHYIDQRATTTFVPDSEHAHDIIALLETPVFIDFLKIFTVLQPF